MRITNGYQMLTHLKNMNNALTNLTNSNNKMSSQRRFDKAWENVADATRAFRVRKQLSSDSFYMTNIRDVQGRLDTADENIQTVNTILRTVDERVVQALNDTLAPSDREKIATEIEGLQKEVLAICNAKYADKYLFSGSGGKTAGAPFTTYEQEVTVNQDGVDVKYSRSFLLYHGMDVNSLSKNETTGEIEARQTVNVLDRNGNPIRAKDANGNDIPILDGSGDPVLDGDGNPTYKFVTVDSGKEIPYDKTNYVNIGLGYTVTTDANNNQVINPESAIPYTFSGAKMFGVGTNSDGVSNNVFNFMGDVVQALKGNNSNRLDECLDQIPSISDTLLVGLTEIGSRSNFVEDMNNIITTDVQLMQETQNKLEGIDIAEEAIQNKNFEMAWMVTLQLGAKTLPSSLFDFMR